MSISAPNGMEIKLTSDNSIINKALDIAVSKDASETTKSQALVFVDRELQRRTLLAMMGIVGLTIVSSFIAFRMTTSR